MSEGADTAESSSSRGRGSRGRGKSRGGLGKYLRARGRGRGFGRPAEFSKRLLLEGEEDVEEDEEEAAEHQAKYSRRHLGTNADRYKEPEPELDSDGEPIVEPEVDLSAFLEKQKLSSDPSEALQPAENEDDVDHSLDNLTTTKKAANLKGKTQQIEWDDSLEDLLREKAAAEATRELKNRFKARSDKLRTSDRPTQSGTRNKKKDKVCIIELSCVDAPPLPIPENERPKTEMEQMEDFLDDLLS
ncbi:hypothetical protein EV360DRAFT_55528 [Lentinula raphanica]|nr:hypothetical protein EV360DRAFT_55528 [Lentinula raphanica]